MMLGLALISYYPRVLYLFITSFFFFFINLAFFPSFINFFFFPPYYHYNYVEKVFKDT